MPSAKEIRAHVARESEFRARLGVPAFAGGVLYFISSIIVTTTLNAAPTVGLVQGIEPALKGVANPAVSPRAPEVKYISSHALALVAGSTIKALSLGALVLTLLLLVDATRFRRPETWVAARPLVLIGGVALAVVTILHQVVSAVQAHNFAVGHDLTNASVEQALTHGTVNVASQYLDLLAALALTAGMIGVCVNAIRVGLVTRWVGVLGIFSAILIFVPIGGATLEIIPAFWLVAMGILYMGRWPNGDPPAWQAGEARPWPTQAERRAEREQQTGGRAEAGKRAPAKPAKSKLAAAAAAAQVTTGSDDAAESEAAAGSEAAVGSEAGSEAASGSEAAAGSEALSTVDSAPASDTGSSPAQGAATADAATGPSSRKRRRKRRVRG